ncbi:transposase [Acidobacterium sp. S8]|uniref:REP-associated tyrosine transposase n=1 Tax=Acidobacterium sp. S8 TaxID=1641854 RepID=UPI00131C1B10|nr:transposase [Acidobacterium sp. S8]
MPLAPQELKTFFITAVTANRRRLFQIESNAELLLKLFNEDRAKNRYQVHAFVIMPDHIHLLITPAPDISIEKAMQFIKGGFSFRLKSKRDTWQSGFTKRRIEDAKDYANHVNYIHENPVRAKLCARPEDFRYSSANIFPIDPTPEHLKPQG